MLSARALYSNTSESPEELSFNQGDVLTVLQKDISGLTGWWLCFIDGRVGLAPGNRLRTLSHVESDNETTDQPPLRQPNEDAKRVQTLKVSQRRNEIDPNDVQQIYDVPPSTLPRTADRPSQNTCDGSPDTIYDVPPPSSGTNTYDKPRRVGGAQEAGEADYQVPRPMRTPSPVPHKSAQEVGSQRGSSNDANGPAGEVVLLPANRGENLSGRAEDGKMGKVRVCVEDDEEVSSEESAVLRGSTPGKFRGGDVVKVFVSSEPDPGNPPGYDPGSGTTGKTTDETLESVISRRLSPSYHDPRSGGNSTTLPRMSEIGTGRPGAPTTTSAPSSSSSGPSALPLQQLKIYDHGNRDSLLDDYSVPTNWKTLPSPRYRPSSDSFGRQQIVQTQPGVPCDQPQSMRDAGKSRRSHSEVRSTGTCSSRLRGEPKSGGGVGGSGGGSEYHLSFVDTGIYVDCPQDPESVSDMMESIRKTVRCQAARIRELCLGFEMSTGGCAAQRHEADVTQMKMSCLSLRTALKEFADLGTGALANAMQSPTRDLSENILHQLEMLRVFSQDLNCSVGVVIASFRDAPIGGCVKLRDALNSLLTIAEDIEQPLASLSDLVAKNSTVIFSAGMALSPAAVLPAIMDIRSASPTVSSGQVAALGSAREFRPLSPNVSPRASSLALALEMRSGSPNSLYVQNPSQGNFVHSPVVRDSKTAMISALPQTHESNYRSSSPMLTVPAALSPDFRTTPPHVPSSPVTSSLPIRKVTVSAPEKPDATQYLQARPLPPVPPGGDGGKVLNSDRRSSPTGWSTGDASDWNSVESDYASIANEAERDMKSNVSVLVGRLTDRSNKDSHLLRPDEGPRPPGGGGGGGGGLSPQFRERMEALRPKTEQTLKLSCAGGSRGDPSGSSSTEIAGFFTDFLTGIDREIVQFYVEEVAGHCDAVQLATDDFLRAVTDGLTTGSELVAVSRQVVLTAHKLLYAGDAITKKLVGDEELRSGVGSVANELCARLKRTVAASKADSDAGASLRRRQMIECMTQVKALSLGLKEMIFARVFDRMK